MTGPTVDSTGALNSAVSTIAMSEIFHCVDDIEIRGYGLPIYAYFTHCINKHTYLFARKHISLLGQFLFLFSTGIAVFFCSPSGIVFLDAACEIHARLGDYK